MTLRFIDFKTSTQQKFHEIDTLQTLALLGFVALNPTYKSPVVLPNAKPNNSQFRDLAVKVTSSIKLAVLLASTTVCM
jgi:hypothetical protein